jgi:hypothetical protein
MKIFMKNRRGEESTFLTQHVLELVIAALGIFAIIGLIVAIVSTVSGNQDKKFARESIDKLAAEIKRVYAGGEYNTEGHHIVNPAGWHLYSFTDEKPNSCLGESCICICSKVRLGTASFQIKKCDEDAACSAANIKKFGDIEIKKDGVFVLINKTDGLVEVKKK